MCPVRSVTYVSGRSQTEAAATGGDNDLVVKGICRYRAILDRSGERVDSFGRALHVQGWVRTLVVEDHEVVDAGLLLQKLAAAG